MQLREVILRSLQLAQLVSLPPGGRVCYGFPRVRGECVSEEGAAPEPSNSSGGNGRNQAGGFPRGVHDFTDHCSLCLKQNANDAKHVPATLAPYTPSVWLCSPFPMPACGVQMVRAHRRQGSAPKPSAYPLACALCLCTACHPPRAGHLGVTPKTPVPMVSPGARGQTTVTNGWWREGHRR